MIFIMKKVLFEELQKMNLETLNNNSSIDIEEKALAELFFDDVPGFRYTTATLGGCTIITCDRLGDRVLSDCEIVAFEIPFISARDPESEIKGQKQKFPDNSGLF